MKDNPEFSQSAMAQSATEASTYLRTLSNPARLLLLCQLVEGEKRVGELEEAQWHADQFKTDHPGFNSQERVKHHGFSDPASTQRLFEDLRKAGL